MLDNAQVQEFFFEAMAKGWARGENSAKVQDLPSFEEICYYRESDKLFLVDRWCANFETKKSAGTTTIWIGNQPVWFMSYGGFYQESAIEFLKRVLLKNYEERKFDGGRGPRLHASGSLIYVNFTRRNDFTRFEGREEIFDLNGGILLGYHDYWGMSLI